MSDTGDRRGRARGADDEAPFDAAAAEASLTPRQAGVLEVIRRSVRERGYPPSIREIGDEVGLASTSSVAHQLRTLERKGLLKRDANRPRAVNIAPSDTPSPDTPSAGQLPEPTFVPVLGRIAAGGPILAEEAVEDVFPLPRESCPWLHSTPA